MRGKILALHEKLIKKEITAEELTKKYLDYIDLYNPVLNAYISITKDTAIASARETDKKIFANEDISPLSGIPMTVKDNICTKDIVTSCGSEMLYNYKPIYNAFAYDLLVQNGAVLLGKTNMDEFAMGSTCETSFYGMTKNPYDTSRVPGGSSGGGSCSVSADMAVYALGSDTGGSIRQPAGFCGLMGLKPTYGAVSRYGLIAYASGFDQIGVLAKSAEDTAIVFDKISKRDKNDLTCIGSEKSASEALENDINGIKIGVITNLFENICPEIKAAINTAIKSFEDMGAKIFEIQISDLEPALSAYYILACAQASSNLARYDGVRYGYRTENFKNTEELICKTRSEAFGKEVKRRIMLGNYVLSAGCYENYYEKAELMQTKIKSNFKKAFETADVLLCPTCAEVAFKAGSFKDNPVSMYQTDLCTAPVNLAGLPAISVPCGYSSENLPIGMQLIGDSFTESLLLNLAYKYEEENFKIMYRKPDAGGLCIEL